MDQPTPDRPKRRTRAQWAVATEACCNRCKEWKPLSDFYPLGSKHHARPVSYNCIPCQSIVRKEHYEHGNGKHTVRKNYLKKMFGLSMSGYEEMLKAQQGRCAICSRTQAEVDPHKSFLPVDHNHKTLRVRALLCTLCNQAIGLMGEDPARLRAAAEYLERHHERE